MSLHVKDVDNGWVVDYHWALKDMVMIYTNLDDMISDVTQFLLTKDMPELEFEIDG